MKKIITLCLSLCMTAALAAPAYALEYSIAAPDDYDFGKDTSIEVIHTADGGAMKNADMSKNAALIPPAFGSESMNALHTGEYLTPNLAPGGIPASGAVIGGSAATVVTPGSTVKGGKLPSKRRMYHLLRLVTKAALWGAFSRLASWLMGKILS